MRKCIHNSLSMKKQRFKVQKRESLILSGQVSQRGEGREASEALGGR